MTTNITYDDKTVRHFMIASIFWGVIGMLVGVAVFVAPTVLTQLLILSTAVVSAIALFVYSNEVNAIAWKSSEIEELSG